MDDWHRSPVSKGPGGAGSQWAFVLGALVILVSLISVCGTAYVVFAAVKCVQWHGAENLALMALMFVGVPTLAVQFVVFLPITCAYARMIKPAVGDGCVRSLLSFAILMPLVTFAGIVVGIALMERR